MGSLCWSTTCTLCRCLLLMDSFLNTGEYQIWNLTWQNKEPTCSKQITSTQESNSIFFSKVLLIKWFLKCLSGEIRVLHIYSSFICNFHIKKNMKVLINLLKSQNHRSFLPKTNFIITNFLIFKPKEILYLQLSAQLK